MKKRMFPLSKSQAIHKKQRQDKDLKKMKDGAKRRAAKKEAKRIAHEALLESHKK
jgi:hypothetical protein